MNATRTSIVMSVSLGLIFLFCECKKPETSKEVKSIREETAVRILGNPAASVTDFELAVQLMETNQLPPSTWLRLAADKRHASDHRRRAVKVLFDHYLVPGMSGSNLLRTLEGPVNWISSDRIQKFQGSGWLPIKITYSQSVFGIPILADDPGTYRLAVFVAFLEDVPLDDFKAALRNGGKPQSVTEARIESTATYDTHDEERRYPGLVTNRWLWHFAGVKESNK